MSKKQTFVIQSSMDGSVSYRNRAVGNPTRVHRRFTRGGKFHSCLYLMMVFHGRKLVNVYRTTYGWGTNQIAWYDWYEA